MPKIIDNIDYSLKELLVDSLQDSSYIYKDFKQQSQFVTTHNCYPFARWDAINESLSTKFHEEDIPFATVPRGFWTMLMFCDQKRQALITVMREDRFNAICRNPEENAPKYLDSLVSLNKGLEAKASQTSFGNIYESNDKYNQLESLCKCLPISTNDSYYHVILLFSISFDEITSIKLCVVNNKFEIVEEEDILQLVLYNRSKSNETIIVEQNDIPNSVPQKGFIKLKSKSIKNIK